MIGVALDGEWFSAGEVVTGTLTWRAERAERAEEFRIRIEWETKGDGNDVFCCAREAKWAGSPREVERKIPFRLLIPHEGPVSYSGTILNIEWKLFASVSIDGARDEEADIELNVQPRTAHSKSTSAES